jgi:hypothetical protein
VESLAAAREERAFLCRLTPEWYWSDSIVDDLVRDGRARGLDGHIVAAGE